MQACGAIIVKWIQGSLHRSFVYEFIPNLCLQNTPIALFEQNTE